MEKVFTEAIADGKHSLQAVVTQVEDGLNIYLGGGEIAHLGTVVVSIPRPSLTGDGSPSCTTSVYNFLGHKDDGLAVPLAEKLCRELGQTVVVTAGVHVDGAESRDIKKFQKNLDLLAAKILEEITGT